MLLEWTAETTGAHINVAKALSRNFPVGFVTRDSNAWGIHRRGYVMEMRRLHRNARMQFWDWHDDMLRDLEQAEREYRQSIELAYREAKGGI